MPDTYTQHFVCANMPDGVISPREDPNVSSCRVDHCSQPSVGGTQGRVTLAKDTDELGVSFAFGWSI